MTDSAFEPPHARRWYVWGMPLSGKTSLGKKLRRLLPFPVFDLDALLEEDTGKTIAELFASEGETRFRERETRLLRHMTAQTPEFLLVTGGGTPCFAHNDVYMKEQGTCLFMHTAPEELLIRSRAAAAKRPLLQNHPEERLRTLYTQRLPVYRTAHAEFFSEAEAIRFFGLRFGTE